MKINKKMLRPGDIAGSECIITYKGKDISSSVMGIEVDMQRFINLMGGEE